MLMEDGNRGGGNSVDDLTNQKHKLVSQKLKADKQKQKLIP